MKGTKYLFKNIGLLTISQFGTKLLSFFLVPLYTYVLSTSEYGTYDIYNTTVSLLLPILTLNISDATLRFSLNNKKQEKAVFSIGIKYTIIAVILATGIIGLNSKFGFIDTIRQYAVFLVIMFVNNSFNILLSNFARGIDCVKEVAISGVICSVMMLSLNILFLLPLNLGLNGYFLANIIGTFSQVIYLFVSIKAWRYFDIKLMHSPIQHSMLNFSRPLILNSVAWWINSASDRYVVVWLCGVSANGIYSVANKIPSILNIFQTIFNQAWTLSAVYDFDSEDKNGFFTRVYNLYNFSMVLVCSVLIVLTKVIAHFLFAKEFYLAWKYAPFLMLSVVFGALSGYIGGIFSAVKDSKIFAKTTLYGAVVNIVLNIVLVYKFGAIGAAIATTVSYGMVWLMRIIIVKKYINLKINFLRDVTAYCILVLQCIVLLLIRSANVVLYSVEIVLAVVILLLFSSQIKILLNKLKMMVKR